MISRYLLSGQTKYIKSRLGSLTFVSNTSTSVTYSAQFLGEPGAVMLMKVTSLTKSNMSGFFKVNGSTYILNDTFNLTLDGAGQVTITELVDVGTSTPGNGIDAILTIMTTTIGSIGTPDHTNISWTI